MVKGMPAVRRWSWEKAKSPAESRSVSERCLSLWFPPVLSLVLIRQIQAGDHESDESFDILLRIKRLDSDWPGLPRPELPRGERSRPPSSGPPRRPSPRPSRPSRPSRGWRPRWGRPAPYRGCGSAGTCHHMLVSPVSLGDFEGILPILPLLPLFPRC